ncbi:hypothetical protein HAX54_019597 [Datura stramonium]|uniref:Uncharacterized protein n=1 Tax=Datura stramonium TaxID=4076 RepID=A0ABS8S2J9_DATST|nr:hypothetical protein [Datura stramonium]
MVMLELSLIVLDVKGVKLRACLHGFSSSSSCCILICQPSSHVESGSSSLWIATVAIWSASVSNIIRRSLILFVCYYYGCCHVSF